LQIPASELADTIAFFDAESTPGQSPDEVERLCPLFMGRLRDRNAGSAEAPISGAKTGAQRLRTLISGNTNAPSIAAKRRRE
jgi:hypothetical protein